MPDFRCGEQPDRSMVIFPCATVTRAWMRTRSLLTMPSLSRNDSASYTPSGNRGDDFAALGFGLVEDLLDGRENRVAAVFLEQLVQAPERQSAGGHLRAHVAERGVRVADVVAHNLEQQLVDLAGLVNFELVELQAFHPGIENFRFAAEAGAHAADVDPVGAHDGEQQQLAAGKNRACR